MPGGLKAFLDKHSDKFAWRAHAGNKGMPIAWASWVAQEGRGAPPPRERPATGEAAPPRTAPQQG
eukprot:4755008-Pyramimonas_sp.AAC.1